MMAVYFYVELWLEQMHNFVGTVEEYVPEFKKLLVQNSIELLKPVNTHTAR
jgi:hypothetical protein